MNGVVDIGKLTLYSPTIARIRQSLESAFLIFWRNSGDDLPELGTGFDRNIGAVARFSNASQGATSNSCRFDQTLVS